MNQRQPTNEEKFGIIYEATYQKRLGDGVASEMLSQIRSKCKAPSIEEIRIGMESITGRFGKFEGPTVSELITAITGAKGQTNRIASMDNSRRYFLDTLRRQPDLKRRATMIFNCGDAYVPECDQTGEAYTSGSPMVENKCRLFVNSRYPADAIKEALNLCSSNAIAHANMNRTQDAPQITEDNARAVFKGNGEYEDARF